MKTAFLINSLHAGGAERVVCRLSNELIKNHTVLIITLNDSTSFYNLDKKIKIICLGNKNDIGGFIRGLFFNLLLLFKLINILYKESINNLICFTPRSNILGIISGKFLRIKVIISERENPYINKIKYWDYLRKKLYKYANKLVVQTEGAKDYFNTFIDNNKIKIIPNPINFKKNDLLLKEKIILTVGRCDNNKNQTLIIKAFAKIDTSWKLILCGDGPLLNELKELSLKLCISDRVEFTGIVKDIDYFYKKASIFALSSKSEGFPNVLLEALSFKCACITTDCPYGPKDMITHNKNGFLIPLNDDESFSYHLNKLVNEDTIRKEFQKANIKDKDKYSLKNIISQWN
jgi:GalNAc-alpha-(1->4)-GalNAc-alpha-(1->3)-diNAcBac-PP-undecaprenol alpha-1,4-N-acetyl-D-galactosaminyltransferase